MRGFLVVDKPEGISSHHVVAIMRALLGKVKIGHTGTLDPFATGVLVLAFGSYTRLISFLPEETKQYYATLKLGEKSATGDTEGEIVQREKVPEISLEDIASVCHSLKGKQEQKPPQFSAVKYKGKPLYSYARKGQAVEVSSRTIFIHQLRCIEKTGDSLCFDTITSRGTYIRQLGEDIAEKLGSVGHLTQLRRTKSGCFAIEEAISLEDISRYVTGNSEWGKTLSREGKSKYPRCSSVELWQKLQPHIQTVESVFAFQHQVEVSSVRRVKIQNGLPPLYIPQKVPKDSYFWYVHEGAFVAMASHNGEKVSLIRVLN